MQKMKLTLEIDGETFVATGFDFEAVIRHIARQADVLEEDYEIRVLEPAQCLAADQV